MIEPRQRQTYWPRYGPAVPPPDIDDDRHCTNCGYNLRGLAYHTVCPECGSQGGMSPSDASLPWDEQRTIGSYVATLYQFFIEPDDFGTHVWRFGHLDWRAARRFRQINTAIAALCGGAALYFYLEQYTRGIGVSLIAWAISMIGIMLWLKSMTLDRLRFLERENLLPRDPQRTKALVSYLSAPLALTPLHLIGLFAISPIVTQGERITAIVMHATILAIQVALGARADAHLIWQLIDIPKAQAMLFGVLGAIWHVITGLFFWFALPAAFALLTKNVLDSSP